MPNKLDPLQGNMLSVGELTRALKHTVEGYFPFVWVQGQVSNLSRPSSGHVYFSLKDAEATLAAVCFKAIQDRAQAFDPLTGEVFEDGPRPHAVHALENGQEVQCAGRLTVYAARGNYQLVVELVQEVGLGSLHVQFEALKKELAGKGFFDVARKRAVPLNPKRVALITAASGAAVHDFLRIAHNRGTGSNIRLYPALMQGKAAPDSICTAFATVQKQDWAEVVVLVRGGGSLEDLWAFNDAALAEIILSCPVPVIAGIGHEVDVTIADMTADVRAATPSHAAQLLWTERREAAQALDELEMALSKLWKARFLAAVRSVAQQKRSLAMLAPGRALQRWDERLQSAAKRLQFCMGQHMRYKSGLLDAMQGALHRNLDTRFFMEQEQTLGQWHGRLQFAMEQRCATTEAAHKTMDVRLAALNPLLPLERGYALVRNADGSFIRSKHAVQAGNRLHLQVSDGEIPVIVTTEGED